MNCNNLKCRCGAADWSLSWSYTDTWQLMINCNQCGAVHTLAQSDDYHAKAADLVSK